VVAHHNRKLFMGVVCVGFAHWNDLKLNNSFHILKQQCGSFQD